MVRFGLGLFGVVLVCRREEGLLSFERRESTKCTVMFVLTEMISVIFSAYPAGYDSRVPFLLDDPSTSALF